MREQEASQLLSGASIALYAIAYVVLFALPLLGRRALRSALPPWVKVMSLAGLISSVVSLVIMVYPIIDVADRALYAAKICEVVVVSNLLGLAIYKGGKKQGHRQQAGESENLSAANRPEGTRV